MPLHIIDPLFDSRWDDVVKSHPIGFLADLRERENIWFALPRDINSWWRARSRMSIVKEGSQWRITGEEKDRAVLAFARSVDGELVTS